MKVNLRTLLLVGLSVAALSVITTWRLYADVSMISLTAETLERVPNKPHIPVNRILIAHRTDGSTAWTTNVQAPNGTFTERREVVNASTRARTVVDVATESLTTYGIPKTTNLAYRPRDCGAGRDTPRSTILGYPVVLRVSDDTRTRRETWVAPSLNCLTMKHVVTRQEEGQTITTMHREVTKVILGDPDEKHFTLPAYQERTPAQFREEVTKRFGLVRTENQETERLDQIYADSH